MRPALLALLVFASCATLNTSGMSEGCRLQYDSCLSACPQADRVGSPTPPPTAVPNSMQRGIDTAACTQQCNDLAKRCK